AEDGIRDFHVTGVQTCALPIFARPDRVRAGRTDRRLALRGHALAAQLSRRGLSGRRGAAPAAAVRGTLVLRSRADVSDRVGTPRSEERRVGKACRDLMSRWPRT